MLTALVVCSDIRAERIANALRGSFDVYVAQMDTEFLKDYDEEAPHGHWVVRHWVESNFQVEAAAPARIDVMFVHTGASDLDGLELANARLTLAFSANGVREVKATSGLVIPISREFPYAGESPVTADDAREIVGFLTNLSNSGIIRKDDVISRIRLCSAVVEQGLDAQRASDDPAVELLALENLLASQGSQDEAELLLAAVTSARQEPGSFGIYSEEQLRPKLWHVCKNVLSSVAANRLGKRVAEFTLERMEKWETRAWGERGSDLKIITEFAFQGDYQAAADRAHETYKGHAAGALRPRIRLHERIPAVSFAAREARTKHFSILVVDDDQDFLRDAVARLETLASSCRDYEIEVLFAGGVGAFSAGLAAVDHHTGIQGIIVDWDLGSKEGPQKTGTGIDLIKQIRLILPRVHACLVTGRGALSITAEIGDSDIRPFNKADADCLEHAFAFIVSSVRDREVMPFFSALVAYSGRHISAFHALAISGGRGVRKSPWMDSFYEFYGDRIFLAETSSTQPPLDSLLAPTGSIKDAEDRAAVVFGADRVRFVTNGTSTANKIVHQALLGPGDVVLIDRTCHKSHHYALVLVGAIPVYVEADPVSFEGEFLGFCRGIRTSAILAALRIHPRAKMLCLTNCTFDGYVHDAAGIIEEVTATLREIRSEGKEATAPEDFIFLFDEAWFGTARFTRSLRGYSAMEAARAVQGARVYATQSTHKTLLAFRQGSMILIRDPRFQSVDDAFSEAFLTHTTTSPNYSIIASLDAGRMWADLDGDRICNDVWKIAMEIRRQLVSDPVIARAFAVLDEDALLGAECDSTMKLDQTKITLYIRDTTLSGRAVNSLLAKEGVQFNKYTNNTVLLIVTPGTTESGAAHLVVAIRRLAAGSGEKQQSDADLRANLQPDAFQSQVVFGDDFDLRSAYFGRGPQGYSKCEMKLATLKGLFQDRAEGLSDCVSSRFVIPYPPGFPLLVPGQCVDLATVIYLSDLDTREIHGMPSRDTLAVWLRTDLIDKGIH